MRGMRVDAQGEYFGGEVLGGGEAARRAFGQQLELVVPDGQQALLESLRKLYDEETKTDLEARARGDETLLQFAQPRFAGPRGSWTWARSTVLYSG